MIRFKSLFFLLVLATSSSITLAKAKTIHVFVALCDNEHQGIVPVPSHLGNGKDPAGNLYWGAAYGVKSFFKNKAADWELVETLAAPAPLLERVLFKHKTQDVYMLADAYDGEQIKQCVEDFILASNGQALLNIKHSDEALAFGGGAGLIAYVGHDGLMDFDVTLAYEDAPTIPRDVMILACFSKSYFAPKMKLAGAHPVLWTTHLMAPEAYTLKAAIDGWMASKTGAEIEELAAQAYHSYQKCGMKGARNLFTTGY